MRRWSSRTIGGLYSCEDSLALTSTYSFASLAGAEGMTSPVQLGSHGPHWKSPVCRSSCVSHFSGLHWKPALPLPLYLSNVSG